MIIKGCATHWNEKMKTINNNTESVQRCIEERFCDVIFWTGVLISIVTSITAVLGNGLVIYAAHQKVNRGRLRYLDSVIRSLAMTDLLFGLIGTPFNYFNIYIGIK